MISAYIIQSFVEKHGVDEVEAEKLIITEVDKAATVLSKQGGFASHEQADIYQYAWMKALEILETDKYDPSQTLGGFIYAHTQNRLNNWRRAELHRAELPCKCCGEHAAESDECVRRRNWRQTNARKFALANVTDQPYEPAAPEVDLASDLEASDLDAYIRGRLPESMLADWETLKVDPSAVEKHRLSAVRHAAREIVRGSPWCPADETPTPPPPKAIAETPPPAIAATPTPVIAETSTPPKEITPLPTTPKPRPEPLNDAKLYTYDGLELTLDEWAERLGVTRDALRHRLNRGLSHDRVFAADLRPKPRKDAKLYSFDGVTLTLSQWAERLGVSKETLCSRLRRGNPPERVFSPATPRSAPEKPSVESNERPRDPGKLGDPGRPGGGPAAVRKPKPAKVVVADADALATGGGRLAAVVADLVRELKRTVVAHPAWLAAAAFGGGVVVGLVF